MQLNQVPTELILAMFGDTIQSSHPQNNEKRCENLFRGCCEWWTFRDVFLLACHDLKVPLLCVDRLQARRHWRAGWTGLESAQWFRNQLLLELYL